MTKQAHAQLEASLMHIVRSDAWYTVLPHALRDLNNAYDKGMLTQQEYNSLRVMILRNIASKP